MRYFAGFAESFYYAYVHGRQAFARVPRSPLTNIEQCVSTKADIDAINLSQYGLDPVPKEGPGSLGLAMAGRHPLTYGTCNRHKIAGLIRHPWNSVIPPGAFALVGSGVYVSTPEFTFLQLARELSSIQMALVGCAMCASYRLDVNTGHIIRCEPLSSVGIIRAFLDQSKGIWGYRTALKVLDLVADGAESPQEINLFLLASLPLDLGGSAIKDLVLNYEIKAEPQDVPILDRATRENFRIDMGIPSRGVGIEYLGKHHDVQQDRDRERLNALMAKGYRILQAKYQDISNPVLAERLTCQFASLLDKECPNRTPTQDFLRARLMSELFGSGRPQL